MNSSLFIYRVLHLDYHLKINNCDSCTAKLYMLICIMSHIRDAAQILADELSEDTVAFSMKNTDAWHTYQDGVIDKILYCIQCFITTHASYIQILMEVGLVGINSFSGFLTDTVGGKTFFAFLSLIHILYCSSCMLQSVQAHLGSHASEYGSSSISVDAFHFSDSCQAFDTDSVAGFYLSFAFCLYFVLCISQSCSSFFLIFLLFSLSLGMSFLALLNLGYLAGNLVIRFLGVNLLNFLFESFEFLTDTASFLLFCLTLSNLSYGILNLLLLSFKSSAASSLAFLRIAFLLRSMSSISLSYLEMVFSISFSR